MGRTIDIERKYRLLKVCYVPATSAAFLALFLCFFAAATNSTSETNRQILFAISKAADLN